MEGVQGKSEDEPDIPAGLSTALIVVAIIVSVAILTLLLVS